MGIKIIENVFNLLLKVCWILKKLKYFIIKFFLVGVEIINKCFWLYVIRVIDFFLNWRRNWEFIDEDIDEDFWEFVC